MVVVGGGGQARMVGKGGAELHVSCEPCMYEGQESVHYYSLRLVLPMCSIQFYFCNVTVYSK